MFLPIRNLSGSQWAGVEAVSLETRIGTGGTTVADTATTSIIMPRPQCGQSQVTGYSMQVLVAAASTGTVTVQVFKRDNSGTPADRTLTGAISIKSDVITTLQRSYAIPITATAQKNIVFIPGDISRIDIVASAAVTTQPTITIVANYAIVKN